MEPNHLNGVALIGRGAVHVGQARERDRWLAVDAACLAGRSPLGKGAAGSHHGFRREKSLDYRDRVNYN